MGRKRTGERQFLRFCIVILILFTSFGCTVLTEKQKVEVREVRNEESQRKAETLNILSGHLLRARKLLEQRDYDGSLKENQKVLSLSGQNPPGDEALFNMGLIYAHFGNPKKEYGRSIGFFRKLTRDYPQSPLAVQARIWMGILQENEKLAQTIQKLNQVIEESKQVDIEIEEKKREKGK
jgi:tetratricopeptide (TPR) repeat protein